MRGTGAGAATAATILVMCAGVAAADGEVEVDADAGATADTDGDAFARLIAIDLPADDPAMTQPPDADAIDASTDAVESVRSRPRLWTDIVSTHCPPLRHADRELHLEFSVGGLGGGYRVGPLRGSMFGFHATAGIRRNRIALLADYALLSFTGMPEYDAADTRDERDARIHRAGVLARYSLLDGSETYPTTHADFYLEAGVGREWLRWYDGGRLARNDIRIGVGGQGAIWFGHHDVHMLGAWLSFALVVSHAPAAKPPPSTCAGPCDAPTRTDPYDVMYWVDIGVPFH